MEPHFQMIKLCNLKMRIIKKREIVRMPNSKRFFQVKFIKKIVSMRITIPT